MKKVFPFLNNDQHNENITKKDSYIYKHKVNINLYKNKQNNIMIANKEPRIELKINPNNIQIKPQEKKEENDDLVPYFVLHPSQYMSSEEQEVVFPNDNNKPKESSEDEKEDISDKEQNTNKKAVLNKSISLTSELEYEYEHPSKMLTKEQFQELIRKNQESKKLKKELAENSNMVNESKLDKINNEIEKLKTRDNKNIKSETNKLNINNQSKKNNVNKNIINENKSNVNNEVSNPVKSKDDTAKLSIVKNEKKKEKYGIKKYSKRKICNNSESEDNLSNHNNMVSPNNLNETNISKDNYQSISNRKSKYIPKEKSIYTINISENKSKKKIKKEDDSPYVKLYEEDNNNINTGKIISNKFYEQLQKYKMNYKYMNKNNNIILHKKYIYDIKLDHKRIIKLPKNTRKKKIINIYELLTIKIIDTSNNTYINIDDKQYKNFKNNDTFNFKYYCIFNFIRFN